LIFNIIHNSELWLTSDQLHEADSHSANQEISCLLWKPKFHYRVHNSPSHFCVL